MQDIPGHRLNDQQADRLQVAVELYRGELMPTWYQDWCIYERERLQSIRIMMLEQLMGYCESRERFARAIAYGQAILRYDRARERTHRELMRLYYLTGDRTAAMRQYERCTRALGTNSICGLTVRLSHWTSRSGQIDWMRRDRALPRRS